MAFDKKKNLEGSVRQNNTIPPYSRPTTKGSVMDNRNGKFQRWRVVRFRSRSPVGLKYEATTCRPLSPTSGLTPAYHAACWPFCALETRGTIAIGLQFHRNVLMLLLTLEELYQQRSSINNIRAKVKHIQVHNRAVVELWRRMLKNRMHQIQTTSIG